MKIVLVEDNPGDQKLFQETLKETGFEHQLFIASDGKEGLELVRRHKPDLLVLDVMMPGMCGYDVCKAVRFDSVEEKGIPIVLLTGRQEEIDPRIGKLMDIHYIPKPCSMEGLRDTIEAVCKKKNTLNILLVDDNPGDQKLFKEAMLEAHIDHQIAVASTAKECLEMIRAQKPDVVFMDVIMPGLSGADFVRMLYNGPAAPSIPVVFLTGVIDGDHNRETINQLNVGGVLFPALGKPVNPRELRDIINAIKKH